MSVERPEPPEALAVPSWSARRVVRAIRTRIDRYLFGMTLAPYERRILEAQIEFYRPDVILNQEMGYVRSEFLRRLQGSVRMIVGQIAAERPNRETYDAYQLVVSSLPNFVSWFRSIGVRAEYNRLAFEPSILDRIATAPVRDIDVSFVGSLSPEHGNRIRVLEFVAKRAVLKVWGNGIERLAPDSPLHACYQGEAWGRRMYEILGRSRVTINNHIDLADGFANNMRLYEATGMGSLMLVDNQRNIGELFGVGAQVVTYSSAEECAINIERMLSDRARCAEMALAGQRHTLHEHTYARRTAELLGLFAAQLD